MPTVYVQVGAARGGTAAVPGLLVAALGQAERSTAMMNEEYMREQARELGKARARICILESTLRAIAKHYSGTVAFTAASVFPLAERRELLGLPPHCLCDGSEHPIEAPDVCPRYEQAVAAR